MSLIIFMEEKFIMVERAVLKRNAKDQLHGKWGLAIAAFVISAIIPCIISTIGSMFESSAVAIIGIIVAIIVSGPIVYGLCTFTLNVVRGKNSAVSDIFAGFNGKIFIKSVVIIILMSVAIGIGYMIFVIPGIILGLMFSQAFFILVDNNDMSAIDCMKTSCSMMSGNKGYLFVLLLSFIGWFILGQITFGIAMLWVCPYYNITLGNFYNELKDNKTA